MLAMMDKDAELVSRIQAGDREAFDALVRSYYPRVRGWVCKSVPVEDREDVTQDIFLQLVRSVDKFQGKSSFSTWFNRLMANVIASYHRKRLRYGDGWELRDPLLRRGRCTLPDTQIEMDDLLDKLPGKYGVVLRLKLQDDLMFKEIGAELGISIDSAFMNCRRGVKYAARMMGV